MSTSYISGVHTSLLNAEITFDKLHIVAKLSEAMKEVESWKVRARAYRNIRNFKNMIYFMAGKVKFDYSYYPS